MKNDLRPLILPMLAIAAVLAVALAAKNFLLSRGDCVVRQIDPLPPEPCLQAAENLPGSVALASVLVAALVGYLLWKKLPRKR